VLTPFGKRGNDESRTPPPRLGTYRTLGNPSNTTVLGEGGGGGDGGGDRVSQWRARAKRERKKKAVAEEETY